VNCSVSVKNIFLSFEAKRTSLFDGHFVRFFFVFFGLKLRVVGDAGLAVILQLPHRPLEVELVNVLLVGIPEI
jgi:hypothetical protein